MVVEPRRAAAVPLALVPSKASSTVDNGPVLTSVVRSTARGRPDASAAIHRSPTVGSGSPSCSNAATLPAVARLGPCSTRSSSSSASSALSPNRSTVPYAPRSLGIAPAAWPHAQNAGTAARSIGGSSAIPAVSRVQHSTRGEIEPFDGRDRAGCRTQARVAAASTGGLRSSTGRRHRSSDAAAMRCRCST